MNYFLQDWMFVPWSEKVSSQEHAKAWSSSYAENLMDCVLWCYVSSAVIQGTFTDVSQLLICLHRGGIGKYHGCRETKSLAESLGKSERPRS